MIQTRVCAILWHFVKEVPPLMIAPMLNKSLATTKGRIDPPMTDT